MIFACGFYVLIIGFVRARTRSSCIELISVAIIIQFFDSSNGSSDGESYSQRFPFHRRAIVRNTAQFEGNTRGAINSRESSFLRGYLKRNILQFSSRTYVHWLRCASNAYFRKFVSQTYHEHIVTVCGAIFFTLNRIFARLKVREHTEK